MEYTTRGVCGQEGCRETRYYLDNGLWFCRRGHQQEVYQLILWKQCHALVQSRGFPPQLEDSSDGGEIEFFSSQPTADQEEPDIVKFGGKHLQWPRLVDSVGLCYLGALLMRLPVGIGDFHR
ncbi:unnamed protein product [Aspergillus oryzae RIB40]|uniref:DNA, SC003 n=1 Tax=Aspergillus oryzae (strain ATCC 42149 / RIB 40) TaxID=510516 RepID=Q2UK64_ASPOR|nr:unnamed protein product [Aspergillus oryzae RIB40]BAE58051.1 unnamed protein product [Aspergillus oryzae RIB40]